MSKAFAEKIIASMVDENGHCGERGISAKQFTFLSEHLEAGEWEDAGSWSGAYRTLYFEERLHCGIIGEWEVTLREHIHFNAGYQVVEIKPAAPEVLEDIRRREEEEQRRRELLSFPNGEHVFEPKRRVDLELTLLRDYECDGYSYSYYDNGTFHVYTFTDDDGNCFVWKTKNLIFAKDDINADNVAEVGSRVTMRATIKAHDEYRCVKQNVITRPCITKVA